MHQSLLTLENAKPRGKDRNQISQLKLRERGGEFLSDVIDVSRRNDGLVQRAVDALVGDTIVCPDFDTAVKLQREAGCRNIVTLDGTEFKQGMIAGGLSSQNLSTLHLGAYELDKDIKKLSEQISKLYD